MYRPKKYIRLNQLPRMPRLADVKNLHEEGKKARSCTVELPWRTEKMGMTFSLTVRVEVGGSEPIWTLYEGEGNRSRVMWSTGFADVDLLYDVLTLSLPSDGPNIFAPPEEPKPAKPAAKVESTPTFYDSEEYRRQAKEAFQQKEFPRSPFLSEEDQFLKPEPQTFESFARSSDGGDKNKKPESAGQVYAPDAVTASADSGDAAYEKFGRRSDIGRSGIEWGALPTAEFANPLAEPQITLGTHNQTASHSPSELLGQQYQGAPGDTSRQTASGDRTESLNPAASAVADSAHSVATPLDPAGSAQPSSYPPGYSSQPFPPQGYANQPYPQTPGYPPQGYPNQPYPIPPGYQQAYPQAGYPGQAGYLPQYPNVPPAQPGYPGGSGQYPAVPYPPYPYPPQSPPFDPLAPAGTVPLSGGLPGAAPSEPYNAMPMPGMTVPPQMMPLASRRPAVMLGTFLVEAGLVPKSTIDSALQVQVLVSQGTLSPVKAAEAVRRAHLRGGAVEPEEGAAAFRPNDSVVRIKPQIGQVLVMAGIITAVQLKAALYLQDVMRNGAMTMEEAVELLKREINTTQVKTLSAEQMKAPALEDFSKAISLAKQAGLVTDSDIEAAHKVREKHGGELSKILVVAGKLDQLTLDAAKTCHNYVQDGKLRVDQAIMALHYCQRMRVPFEDAADELGIDI